MKSPLATFRISSPRRQEGMALIITLALIVLVTVAAVAFLTRATGNRAIEASRSNEVLASQLADTGADYTISTFLQEIVNINNSIIPNSPSPNYAYLPKKPPNMIPQRLFASDNSTSTNPSDPNYPYFANLVRQSVPDTVNKPPLEANASLDSTAILSQNQVSVGQTAWNRPQLISGKDPTSYGFYADNQLPNWIYVNQDGSLTSSITAQNASNVVGRFAYNAYDIGGLLDANVAGYIHGSAPLGIDPTSVDGLAQLSRVKGTLGGADLSLIPGFVQLAGFSIPPGGSDPKQNMDTFVKARNIASVDSDYVAAVQKNAANGFLTPQQGDLYFGNRQDLIQAVQSGTFGCSTNALPYLTHFTRELARPSLGGFEMMTNRFDLSQISNIRNNATKFGLILGGGANSWDYTATISSTPSTTIDFFSLLRSGIDFTTPVDGNTITPNSISFTPPAWVGDQDLKAVMIGANIIDQFTTANPTPTFITTPQLPGGNYSVAGKKQLPFISSLSVYCVYTAAPPGGTDTIDFAIIPTFGGQTASISVQAAGSGQLSVGGASIKLGDPGTFADVPVNPGDSVDATGNLTTTPQTTGFFHTILTFPHLNTPPTSVKITLSGISFTLSAKDSSITSTDYCSYWGGGGGGGGGGANNVAPISATLIWPATLPFGTPTVPVLQIFSEDPRTLNGAGAQTAPTSANASDPPYTASITDTLNNPPTNGINGVGELGYVFRESPWRTIDFVSGTTGATPSADYKLLDLFSAYPTPASGVRAGVVNLNTRQTNVLAALLSGTPTAPNATATISSDDAATIASEMIALTNPDPANPTAAPWTNRFQLVDLVQQNIKLGKSALGTEKTQQESIVRALAEVGQTRTWNLLIDVIAQAGHFSTNSLSAGSSPTGSQFIVGGENRIWVSTAIDRFTGQVIDRQVEQVK